MTCCIFSVLASINMLVQNTASADIQRWVQSSNFDFACWPLVDGGANDYVSAYGSVRMINRWDLNGDSHIDLVLPGSPENEYNLNSYEHSGGKVRYFVQMVSLPRDGAGGETIPDLNKNGYPALF